MGRNSTNANSSTASAGCSAPKRNTRLPTATSGAISQPRAAHRGAVEVIVDPPSQAGLERAERYHCPFGTRLARSRSPPPTHQEWSCRPTHRVVARRGSGLVRRRCDRDGDPGTSDDGQRIPRQAVDSEVGLHRWVMRPDLIRSPPSCRWLLAMASPAYGNALGAPGGQHLCCRTAPRDRQRPQSGKEVEHLVFEFVLRRRRWQESDTRGAREPGGQDLVDIVDDMDL